MTRDDIINMASQAGIDESVWFFNAEALEQFAAFVADIERKKCADFVEACANLSAFVWNDASDSVVCKHFASSVANAIRARGDA